MIKCEAYGKIMIQRWRKQLLAELPAIFSDKKKRSEKAAEELYDALVTASPEIFNTDQGVQFTSLEFISRLERAGIKVSMDGRGRVFDNIFVERLWRTVKYEEVYLHNYQTVSEARSSLRKYFQFYNFVYFNKGGTMSVPFPRQGKKRVRIVF